jgi:DNA topoisomerase-1
LSQKNVKNLVIVESPAKAKTINKFLGRDYLVESCFGHIKDLPKNKLGVDIESHFKPTYVVIPGKKKVINKLRRLSAKAEKIFLATDMDREGEAISWHLSQELNHKKKLRIVFNQITKKALQEAIVNPGPIDKNKVDAQQGRRVLDRLVGYRLSPLLWDKVKRGLSAGRVQSVAVRILCQREEEIEAFSREEHWNVSVIFKDDEGNLLEADLYRINGKKPKIKEEKIAKEIAQKLPRVKCRVKEVKRSQSKRPPYPPFTTSTLQQVASFHLKFSPTKTMRIAQDLYEGQDIGTNERVGLITYMRTDSTRVAKEAQITSREWIKKNLGKEFVPPKIFEYKNKKTSQDAHEAIRPTRVDLIPQSLKKYLSPDHYKLYDLIWRRFISSQMAKAIINRVVLEIEGAIPRRKDTYRFKLEGREIQFPGFLKVYREKREKEKVIPVPGVGTLLSLRKIILKQGFTQPPPRYSEATLIKTLEEKGIGRPSTYAPIISTIQRRGYVRWVKGKLIPTPLARVVNTLLVNSFSVIMDTGFTAKMEEGLDEVEQGKKSWVHLVGEFYQRFQKDLERAETQMRNIKEEGLVATSTPCQRCGKSMVVKIGRFGEFLACSGYPQCRNTQPLDHKIGMKCPFPGCGGEVVEKITSKGKEFYACNRYPECRFLSWDEPVDELCPGCHNAYLVKTAGGLRCPKCEEKIKNEIVEEIDLKGVSLKIVKLRRSLYVNSL